MMRVNNAFAFAVSRSLILSFSLSHSVFLLQPKVGVGGDDLPGIQTENRGCIVLSGAGDALQEV